LSGPGLVNIYRFLCECEPLARNELVAAEMMNHDGAAVICQAALEHSCPVCERSLDVFVSLYAAEAGNLALKVMATGGLYIGGGIAPKIIDRLRQPAFLDSFAAKGRLQPVLERIPIRVIMTDRAAFFGAARYALKQRARHEGDDLASDRVARRGRHTVGTG
jgi:glucokinase